MEQFDVIVLAGGRIDGEYAKAAGTTIKALVPLAGFTALDCIVAALRDDARFAKICVVGPDDLRPHLTDRFLLVPEHATAPQNLLAALERCDTDAARVLICASDTPMIDRASLVHFVDRIPAEIELAIPTVPESAFSAAYPGSPAEYVTLKTGPGTIGSQMVIDKAAIRRCMPQFEAMFARRKSQIAMAGMLGPKFILKLLTRQLTVVDIERKVTQLTGCRAAAIIGSDPRLAFDIDTLEEWRDAQKRLGGQRAATKS